MESIRFESGGETPGVPRAIRYRYCPKDPVNHWRVMGAVCEFCRTKIVEVRYLPEGSDGS